MKSVGYPNLPKNPKDVVFDLDDFQLSVEDISLGYLFYLKGEYPKFKVTLFTIPGRCTQKFLDEVCKHDWIQLAVHGWRHGTNYECAEWTEKECHAALDRAEAFEVFTTGFKAPGWQISDECYEALLKRGYWVADQGYNNDRRPVELPAYLLSHPWCIHGHTWDIQTDDPLQRNGIRQLREERGLKFTPETNFYFIDDVIHSKYPQII